VGPGACHVPCGAGCGPACLNECRCALRAAPGRDCIVFFPLDRYSLDMSDVVWDQADGA
jgi:hypothetical protein